MQCIEGKMIKQQEVERRVERFKCGSDRHFSQEYLEHKRKKRVKISSVPPRGKGISAGIAREKMVYLERENAQYQRKSVEELQRKALEYCYDLAKWLSHFLFFLLFSFLLFSQIITKCHKLHSAISPSILQQFLWS